MITWKHTGILSVLAIILHMVLTTAPTDAAVFDVAALTSMAGDCEAAVILRHNAFLAGTTIDSAPDKDVVNLVLYDGHGNAFAYIGISITVPTSGNISNLGWNYPFVTEPQSRPFTLKIFDNTNGVSTSSGNIEGAQNGTILETIIFDPLDFDTCEQLSLYVEPKPFNDGRINHWDQANPIVVYGQDMVDGRGLVVYSDTGQLLMVVEPSDFFACPETNTMIASENGVSLYHLATCEYQIMSPTLDDTKTYIMIFTELYPDTPYTSYEE